MYTHIHIHTHIYIYTHTPLIYIYIYISSSSSCRAASADIPDPLSPFIPIIHRPPAGLQGYILCPHIVAVCKFVLVVLLFHIHMWRSTGVHRL